jgi:Cyclic nucleotide-binding domain
VTYAVSGLLLAGVGYLFALGVLSATGQTIAWMAAKTDLSMNWLRPYMKKRKYREGDILFRKGDPADEMFLVGKGKYRVVELDNELQPGQIFGELGLLTTVVIFFFASAAASSAYLTVSETFPLEVRACGHSISKTRNSDFISFISRATGYSRIKLARKKRWPRNARRILRRGESATAGLSGDGKPWPSTAPTASILNVGSPRTTSPVRLCMRWRSATISRAT